MPKRKFPLIPKSSVHSENQLLRWGIPSFIFAVTFIVFLPALKNGFVDWDDVSNFVDNWKYRGLGLEQLKWMFTTFHMGPYQPLSWVTCGLDYLVWGMIPFGYHLTNVVLHSLNAFIFCLLSIKLLAAGSRFENRRDMNYVYFSAGLAALFFSIHPLRVESVAWVTERRDVLSGFFYLLTIFSYLLPRFVADDNSPFWRRHILPLSLFLLALLSKGIVISLPLVLVILDIYPLRRVPISLRGWSNPEFRPIWLEKVPYFALALVFGVVGYFGQQEVGAIVSSDNFDVGSRVSHVLFSSGFYIWKTIVPINLVPIYQAPAGFGLTSWQVLFSAAFMMFITAVGFALRRAWPLVLAVWISYLITAAPVSGIVKIGAQIAADRYTYLSCLGLAILAGAGFLMGMRSTERLIRNSLISAALIVLFCLGVLSWRQTQIWHDSETLWRYTLGVNNDLHLAHNNLGMNLNAQGKTIQAIAHYRDALRINPTYAEAYNNMGIALFTQGKSEEAFKCFTDALRIAPRYAEPYYNMGVALYALGRPSEAVRYLEDALRIKPNYSNAHHKLGLILASQGKFDQAIWHYREALRINPGLYIGHYNLGVSLAAQGKLDESQKSYLEELRINPGCAEAHLNLCVLLFNQGKSEAAVEHCQEAIRLKPDYKEALNNLAVILKSSRRQ